MNRRTAIFCLSIVLLFGNPSVSWSKISLPRDIGGYVLLSKLEDAKRTTKSCKDPVKERFAENVFSTACELENGDEIMFQTNEAGELIISIVQTLKMEIDVAKKMVEKKYGPSNGVLSTGFGDIPTWEDDTTRLFIIDFSFISPSVLLVLRDKRADFKIRNKDIEKLKSILGKLPGDEGETDLVESQPTEAADAFGALLELNKLLTGAGEEKRHLRRKLKTAKQEELKNLRREKASKYLSLREWDASKGIPSPDGIKYVAIFYKMKNLSDKKMSIVDGNIIFEDKLGKFITSIKIEDDINLKPKEERVFGTKQTSMFSLKEDPERLRKIDKKLVNIFFDIKQIMFADGSVVQF